MTATLTDRRPAGSPDVGASPAGATPRGGQSAPARWPAELAVLALTAATAASFWRVFIGWRFLPALLAAAAASHALAWGCRRVRLPVFAAVPVSVAGLGVYAGLAWYRSTTRFGVPTGRTITALRTDLRAAMSQFATAVPPVVARGGFLVAAAVGVWLIAFLSDSLAFRAMAGVEAVLPPALGFTLTSAVGAGRLRLPATFLWLIAAMLTVAMLRALRAATAGAWLAGRSRSLVAVARWAALAGLVAALVGVFGGMRVPGYGKSALVSTRNKVAGTAIAVSPFVDLKPRLSSRTPATAFTVQTDGGRSYWRLTTLDEFDGRRWQSPTRNYQKASGPLKSFSPPAGGTSTTATITIAGLTNEFVPAAAVPTSITSKRKVAWEPDLQSLILPGSKLKKGDTFVITSVRPGNVTADELRAASPQDPSDIATRYLDIPTSARRSVAGIALEQTAAAPTRYDKMLALQGYFRDQYTYSLNVKAGSGLTAIEAFLQAKQGYCEQFSATFAAMARSLGIPARVAVGFTYGKDQGNGSYLVQDRHAHAWPEIYFDGYGWIPFEPTPGRGNPDAEQITGVLTQQDGEAPAAPKPTGSVAPTPNVPIPSLPPITEPKAPGAGIGTTVPKDTGPIVPAPVAWFLGIVVGAAGLLLLWVGTIRNVTARRWRRRRAAATSTSRQVLLSWYRAVDGIEQMGGGPVPSSETASQIAARLAGRAGVRTDALSRLAELATVAGFSGVDVEPTIATQADELAETVRSAATAHLGRAARWRLRLDPRPLWRPLPGDRHERTGHDVVVTSDRV